ncbi:hypothetical protein [Isoptericola sp. NPDC057191]|uniref:hypothetical protein n=1 Tax=Isoptericola sp. NPDC057191 TaxID=3346041 RepID=UPI0036286F83
MAAVGALLALALVSTGLVVPSAVADDVVGDPTVTTSSEDATVITTTEDHWWVGQDVTLDVSVTRDGVPGTGYVQWLEDGVTGFLRRVPLSDGQATIVVPSVYLGPGHHAIAVRHVDSSASVDPVTREWPYHSADEIAFEVTEPASPVLDATSWYYGDAHELRFDLTGTDQPQDGIVTAVLDRGVERSVPVVDGVGTFALDGTEVGGGANLHLRHTTTSGSLVATWMFSVDTKSKPVTVTVSGPAAVRYGSDVVVPVRVTSPLGTPEGRVFVTRDETQTLASAVVVDGRATLRFPASRLPFGEARMVVTFNGSWEYGQTDRTYAVVVRPRATSVAVSTSKTWTYGKARRVSVAVSSPGATPTGRVELWWNGHKVRSATLARGKASLYVPATRASAGKHRMVVKYVGPSTFARAERVWYQRVAQARPRVTFRMDRTSLPNDWSTRSVGGTVTVRTPGLPERGKLCVWSRDPHDLHTQWSGCWINWSWTVKDGQRRIRVPGHVLGISNVSSGKTYVKVQFIPANHNVRSVFSNTITLRHYAP